MDSSKKGENLRWIILTLVVIMNTACGRPLEHLPPLKLQNRGNTWFELTQSLNTNLLCLPSSNIDDPFKSCVIGIPQESDTLWFFRTYATINTEPLEVGLLGSVKAKICFRFKKHHSTTPNVDVTPHTHIYKNASLWCEDYADWRYLKISYSPEISLLGSFYCVETEHGLTFLCIRWVDHAP
ncbi:hypothetical protein BTVI_00853 [Pitangus sulphuratus]|nr:hypothetical protein BTVI_00853 [Pitangus sulphuratus]